MTSLVLKILFGVGMTALILGAILFLLARKEEPDQISYGMSFNAPYALELGLDPMTVLTALIDEMGIRDFRLAAHWTLIEPSRGKYDFTLMDEEVKAVERVGGTIIFGVGRRLPRWPECHIPEWASGLTWDEQKDELREYIRAVVTRYKNSPALTYWQVENEPFLGAFAREECGSLDQAFLDEEIALVRSLDPAHPILITDSGNLGTWKGAYSRGDAFGTSVYVYFWNPELGKFKSLLPPWFYRVKENVLAFFYGHKQTFLIELSLEPWLIEPIQTVPLDVQFTRMNDAMFDEIIAYAKKTRYPKQYLWGGEWWYWLKEKGNSDMWEKGMSLFTSKE